MDYTRRQFLKLAAAGLPIAVAAPLLFDVTARAENSRPSEIQGPGRGTKVSDVVGQYDQATADRIHERSVEREIIKAGKTPGEVKAEVDRRVRGLKADAARRASGGAR